MGYEIPESIAEFTDEQLTEHYAAAFDEYKALTAKADDEVTDADLDRMDVLAEHLDAITGVQGERAEAAAAREAKLAAARERVTAAETTPEPEPEPTEEAEVDEPAAEEDAEDAEAQIEEKEPVMASASSVEKAIGQSTQGPAAALPRAMNPVALIASGKSLASMTVNEEFEDLTAVALEFAKTAKRGPAGDMTKFQLKDGQTRWGLSKNHQRNAFAKFQRSGREFEIGQRMSADDQLRLINEAGKMPTGSTTAILAAGGWCAPSETMYDFCSYETVSGMLDVPTITVSRGGINFSKGPDYATIAADANSGFHQTEAEAEAGTTKVCIAVECPPFEEVRLDVVGFCLTNGILTDTAYPELTRRYLEILTVAHAHAVNKYVIDAILADVGAAVAFAGLGATTADLLEAISFNAWRLRTMYAMGPNATIEGFLPTWAKPVIQADLSRRTGVDMLAVSDAQINSYLAARNVRIQFIEDYLPMDPADTAWPTTIEGVLYPAGAFIKGTDDVISLDSIYDSVNISTNTYTAAFMEEGILVANRCGSGLAFSVDLCQSGQTGAADIACAVV